MSLESDLEAIRDICERLEDQMNAELRNAIEMHNKGVVANILVNVGTSMLAKAVLLVKDEHKDAIVSAISHAMSVKVSEGEAAIESLMAIDRAMQMKH